jgi:hypothetical protein
MSEPREPSGAAGEGGAAAPEQATPPPTVARLRGWEGWTPVAIGLAVAVLLVTALVATGPLWAPLLPWAPPNEPAPDPGTTRAEAPRQPRQPQSQPAEGAVNAALQGFERRVAALEARPAAPAGDLAEIREELARLAGSAAELAARIEAIDKDVSSKAVGDPTDTALMLALLQIRDAIDVGRPFAPAYEALVALAQARPEIAAAAAPLAEPATTGVPGRPVLANRLRELADAIAASAPANANAAEPDWADEVWRRLGGLVAIRRIDGADEGQPGSGPAAAVQAALRALAGRDLAGAVATLDVLTGAPAEAARPWLRMAKERLAAEAALQKIEALLAARLGTPANPPAGPGPQR